MNNAPDIVVLGAGIAGLAAAYHLAVKCGVKHVTIVDEREPLGLTSQRGTMAYRNWFPGPGDTMVRFTNRSIDLLEEIDTETNHAIHLTRGGYVYLTANPAQVEAWRELARQAAARGVGPFRDHSTRDTAAPDGEPAAETPAYVPSPAHTWRGSPDGSDLVIDAATIHALYPGITPDVLAMLHVRRCGGFDVFALADWLLGRSLECGAELVRARVTGIHVEHARVQAVQLSTGETLATGTVVIAAGPLLPQAAAMLGLTLPIASELHAKVTFPDTLNVLPRYGDLVYWADPQRLAWSDERRAELQADPASRWLLDEVRAGVHYLPKGSDNAPRVMALWTYDIHEAPYADAPRFDPDYPRLVSRGLARVFPAAAAYFGKEATWQVDGGYYCKTRENRPLIGPLPVGGAYVCGALSGFGVMAAQAAGELVAAHITGAPLPSYADAFLLSRYDDPTYQELLQHWDARSGQL